MFDNARPGVSAHTVKKKNIAAAGAATAARAAAAATGHTNAKAAMAYTPPVC